ncbi:rhodanese-like domain-containing protein [Paenibacillus sp. YAF4_2]|uniref:rhodanese-like domain-containing protein n=1 Tax=Paenibacillus sp. YAF4_2 TaxID=3233085 RepID=UPI003F9A75DE
MGTAYTDLTFHELQAKINKRGNVKIIDVRTPKSFERGHIKGAINIPYPSWSMPPKVSADEEVVIICYVGMASRKASERLAQSHDKVFNFKGGMAQWQGEIEAEMIGSTWSAERIYNFVLGIILLLTLPLSFLSPWWGISYSSFIALGVILFGVTNYSMITKIIRSYGFK